MSRSQNELMIDLLVKNQMYKELSVFKKQKNLPESERMTGKQKYNRIKQLIEEQV